MAERPRHSASENPPGIQRGAAAPPPTGGQGTRRPRSSKKRPAQKSQRAGTRARAGQRGQDATTTARRRRAASPAASRKGSRTKSRQGGNTAETRQGRSPGRHPFRLRADQNWYGVGTAVAIVEAEGRERRIRIGGIQRLYRRPAQRPRHRLVEAMPDEAIAKLFAAFGHPQRVAIMKAIFAGAGTYADLREKVGLKAGPMYHHLRELRLAGVLADGPRDVYRLTALGRDALVIACSIASIR